MADNVFPPDYTTELGKLRALIPDVELQDYNSENDPEYLFDDAHLNAYLSLYATSLVPTARIKRAAADALTAIGVSEALVSKVIKTEDLQTDGAKVANALLAAAARLRKDAQEDEEAAEDEYGFAIVDFQPQPPDYLPASLHGYPYGAEIWSGVAAYTANDTVGFGRWF